MCLPILADGMPTIWRPTTGGPADMLLRPVSDRLCDQIRVDSQEMRARNKEKVIM
jgi:hypothetical protein